MCDRCLLISGKKQTNLSWNYCVSIPSCYFKLHVSDLCNYKDITFFFYDFVKVFHTVSASPFTEQEWGAGRAGAVMLHHVPHVTELLEGLLA